MQLLEGNLLLSPSDLSNAVACRHLVALQAEVAAGGLTKPAARDVNAELLAKHGIEHELRFLAGLKEAGRSVTTVELEGREERHLRDAQSRTLEAMASGVDYVFQATFFDKSWRGHADFLQRVDTPSNLGPFSYEVIDAKLARHAKVTALLQTSNYSEHVARLQGVTPHLMHLELGDGRRQSFPVNDFDAYYRTIKRAFEEMIAAGIDTTQTYPERVSHCAVCDWADVCKAQRRQDDHLALVARMRRSQIQRLNGAGITTVVGLSGSNHDVAGIGPSVLDGLRRQARLQLQQRATGEITYELLEPPHTESEERKIGFGALPQPDAGDLFFDMEGDPYVGQHGIEYLFGVTSVDTGKPVFTPFWGHDTAGEKRAFEQFVEMVMAHWAEHPDMHIFHYAPYETTAMKKLAARYGTKEREVDRLLSKEVFVDLYRVVRQSLLVSQDSYSIKKIEPFYMPERQTEVVGGGESIIAYETWLETGAQHILDDIEQYNRDDCESTLGLRDWLEERRAEAVSVFGDIPRPVPDDKEPSDDLKELEARIDVLEPQLCAPWINGDTSTDAHGQWLLGQLLEWHRRERKSEWWRYFELRYMSEAELFADREAMARLTYVGVVDTIKRSSVHRYTFDIDQDHKLSVGTKTHDSATNQSAGEVMALDDVAGIIDLKRDSRSEMTDVTALIPPSPLNHKAQELALLSIGTWVAENGLTSGGPHRNTIDLLLRNPPRLASGRSVSQVQSEQKDAAATACALACDLDQSTLAIQGPPGSGKTFVGADMVLALVAEGKKVGVCATGHKVIGNLLDEIAGHARKKNRNVRMLQKANEQQRCAAQEVQCAANNNAVFSALADVDVIGGTAWLFACEEMAQSLDVLIVDEAGQMSLADVLAVSTSARSLVLLGDPQQLAQPGKGIHPEGAEASALSHLLDGKRTVPVDSGLLLDRTWRMHPEICTFVSDRFYESRLGWVPDCEQQTIAGDDVWSGTGLRYLPVRHEGNKTSSEEEAMAIGSVIEAQLGRQWVNRDGESAALTLDDILVVAPYNAQVSTLRATLPAGTRIGTVDKFQGQQAAVVLYSMAASSPEDISRGMGFLFSLNRFNVAVSRAMCMTVVTCSPELLTIDCHSPEQARMANALCSYVERAAVVS